MPWTAPSPWTGKLKKSIYTHVLLTPSPLLPCWTNFLDTHIKKDFHNIEQNTVGNLPHSIENYHTVRSKSLAFAVYFLSNSSTSGGGKYYYNMSFFLLAS